MRWGREGRPGDSGTTIERIVTFSDGVFAIAITLLVLQITLPDIPDDQVAARLPGVLRDLIPKFISYAFTFLVIGMYWMAHHRIFNVIRRYDRRLLWLNLIFLLFIGFLPFPSQLVGAHGNIPLALIFYNACLAITGLSMTLIWVYASFRHRLIDPATERRAIAHMALRGLVAPVTALIVAAIAIVDTTDANFGWLLVAPFSMLLGRIYRVEQAEEDAREFAADAPADAERAPDRA